jgi:hypothetical protein
MIVEMTYQNPTTSQIGDHPEQQWATGHRKIPSCQPLENGSQQLN